MFDVFLFSFFKEIVHPKMKNYENVYENLLYSYYKPV